MKNRNIASVGCRVNQHIPATGNLNMPPNVNDETRPQSNADFALLADGMKTSCVPDQFESGQAATMRTAVLNGTTRENLVGPSNSPTASLGSRPVASENPDGYWYRIASAPWSNGYYSPANTFMNGDPYGGPYTR
jgi:hypothetical protein